MTRSATRKKIIARMLVEMTEEGTLLLSGNAMLLLAFPMNQDLMAKMLWAQAQTHLKKRKRK